MKKSQLWPEGHRELVEGKVKKFDRGLTEEGKLIK